MFEQAVLSNAHAGRRAWTTGLGFAGEALFVASVALAPILWPQAMPKPQALLTLLTPPAPLPPRSTAAVKPRATHAPAAAVRFVLPARMPATAATIVDDPPEAPNPVPGMEGTAGDPNGLLGGILGRSTEIARPPAAVNPTETRRPAETAASVPKRIRTSTIELARLVHRVDPVYPQVARMARVSGTVELTGVIGTDGRIRELRALSGNALLIGAAIEAVKQWIYAPPVLNGERVEVIAPITVNFRLDR
jgi:protein TonB